MAHFARRWSVRWSLILGGLLIAGAAQRAAADEIETRQFAAERPVGKRNATRAGEAEARALPIG